MKHTLLVSLFLLSVYSTKGQDGPDQFIRNDSVFEFRCIVYTTYPSSTKCDTVFLHVTQPKNNRITIGEATIDNMFARNMSWFINGPDTNKIRKGWVHDLQFTDTGYYAIKPFDAMHSIITLRAGIDSLTALRIMMYRLDEVSKKESLLSRMVYYLNLEKIDQLMGDENFHKAYLEYKNSLKKNNN